MANVASACIDEVYHLRRHSCEANLGSRNTSSTSPTSRYKVFSSRHLHPCPKEAIPPSPLAPPLASRAFSPPPLCCPFPLTRVLGLLQVQGSQHAVRGFYPLAGGRSAGRSKAARPGQGGRGRTIFPLSLAACCSCLHVGREVDVFPLNYQDDLIISLQYRSSSIK